MELRVEAIPGCSLPNGCFIGVRVGEVLKQGKYDPSCCYRFPAVERQRNAKIDLYQHLGTCSAIVDPENKANKEVKVSGMEPGLSELRLKVSSRPEASEQKEEQKTKVKKQAKDYLGRHHIEERLCGAVKALLAAQPEDPTEFLVAHLRESTPPEPLVAACVQDAASVQDLAKPVVPEAAPSAAGEPLVAPAAAAEAAGPEAALTSVAKPEAAPTVLATPAATESAAAVAQVEPLFLASVQDAAKPVAPEAVPSAVAEPVVLPEAAPAAAAEPAGSEAVLTSAAKPEGALASAAKQREIAAEIEQASSTKLEALPERSQVLDEKMSSFQGYYNNNLVPHGKKNCWDALHLMFPGPNRNVASN